MAESQIEWTDSTWNPVAGCSIMSSGCTNCYAMQMARRLEAMGVEKYDGLIEKYNDSHIIFDKTRESYPDSLLMDSDHLNQMGAKRFTTELIEYVKEVNH